MDPEGARRLLATGDPLREGEMLATKRESVPARKHGNIPL